MPPSTPGRAGLSWAALCAPPVPPLLPACLAWFLTCLPSPALLPLLTVSEEPPNGVTAASSVSQLKAACKAWGLPVSGSKPDLWQRLLDEAGGRGLGGAGGLGRGGPGDAAVRLAAAVQATAVGDTPCTMCMAHAAGLVWQGASSLARRSTHAPNRRRGRRCKTARRATRGCWSTAPSAAPPARSWWVLFCSLDGGASGLRALREGGTHAFQRWNFLKPCRGRRLPDRCTPSPLPCRPGTASGA